MTRSPYARRIGRWIPGAALVVWAALVSSAGAQAPSEQPAAPAAPQADAAPHGDAAPTAATAPHGDAAPYAGAAAPVEPLVPVAHRRADLQLDWSEWQRLPVFDDGRIKPLDTLADEIVTLVTGRSKWNPFDAATPAEQTGDNPPPNVVYRAPELLYAWITEPERWATQRVIRCEYRALRQLLHDAKPEVAVEGTYVALDDILDWSKSRAERRPVYRSAELERRVAEIDRANRQGKAPNTVGDDSSERALNGKVGELFRHMEAFLTVRDARRIFVVPGLDPRILTEQTNPDDALQAWIPLGSLLHPENWRTDEDLTIAALMASDPVDLLNELLARRNYPEKHPNHPARVAPVLPQLAQVQKFREPLMVEVRAVKPALDATRAAYDRGDAAGFQSSMQSFVRQIGRLAQVLDETRPKMTAPEARSIDFGEWNDLLWSRYTPLELSPAQMSLSKYPSADATHIEILYNRHKPFQWAWVYFLIALVIVSLSLIVRWQRAVYLLGLAATLGAIAYSTWGFALRILIAGRPPVTNMYETVIWVSFVVAVLGFWFCLLPLTWPGLRWSWQLCGLPIGARRDEQGRIRGVELARLQPGDEDRLMAGAILPIRTATSVLRLALFAGIVWFLSLSGTSFQITSLTPPIFGKVISVGSLGTWFVGLATVLLTAWFTSRAALALAGLPLMLVPEARRDGAKLWEQTFTRRYFLFGALPVACFGMMLAHFVGMTSPDILNPRVGSIAAVLRNNYWLTIHVLTIVSSYGAGALAWGIGNLALLYYLFGRYRTESAVPAGARSASVEAPAEEAAAREGEADGLLTRLGKAGTALRPGMLRRTLKAGFEDFGTGDQHLAQSKVRPPREVSTLASYAYKTMQVAVLLLAAGTILGGLWADVSWGRFWDWDPKEVWALISLLAYLVVLHGRFAGWVGTFGTNVGSVLCFNAILFSWYGVNFVLPMVHGWLNGTGRPTEVGLHAYATGAGGLEYVAGGVLLNLLLVAAAWGRYATETIDLTRAASVAEKAPAAVGKLARPTN